ncbi:MAG TPA: 1,2-phenylacetyl-CoA epoxidase subunit PaaD [Candidatus Limnocylindrales bacterium]
MKALLGSAVVEAAVRSALAEVPDPEIPVVSVVDLGMVESVEVDGDRIRVELLPTFVGCPALDLIRDAVTARLSTFGRPVEVEFGFRVPWTSDRITPAGRSRLRASGFAPPDEAACPHCGSANVALENLFGPTQCRSIYWCRACRQPFESFKSV